jgi:hypothetical protein
MSRVSATIQLTTQIYRVLILLNKPMTHIDHGKSEK